VLRASVNDTVLVAAIGAMGIVVSPLLLAYLTGRQRAKEKIEDWRRQDAVAAQAAEAAALLLAANADVARIAKATAEGVNGKLNQIHELVNSTLTGALEDQLLAREQLLVMMRRDLNRDPDPDAQSAVVAMEAVVAELRSKLADRAKQTEIADAQVK
jgi:hypothetical protein